MIIESVKLGDGLNRSDDDDNLNLTHISKTPTTLSPMGKQKKPNEIKDQISPSKKKKHPGSISEHALPDHARKSMSSKRKKTVGDVFKSVGEVKSSTMIRAEEVQSSLGAEFPSFVKVMVRAHVSTSFLLRFPALFCKSHVQNNDAMIILEDESGARFEVKFIATQQGFSGGWRKFSILHKLLAGDVLVFQLTEANKFKVYIIRANASSTEVNGSLGLLNLDADTKQNDADNVGTRAPKSKKRKCLNPSAMVRKKNEMRGSLKSVSRLVSPVEKSENDSEVIGSKLHVDSESSSSSAAFEDIKSFEDFKSTVNMLRIDSELPEHIWTKYYELCSSQNSFLHAHLLQGLNCPLVTGIIFETVSIADAIRGCKLTTSRDEFASWEKTLKSFELVGMNVVFLLARLRRLQILAFESEDALEAKKYIEAETQRAQVENRMRDLKAELVQLKKVYEKIDADVGTLASGAVSYELKFQKLVDTPW